MSIEIKPKKIDRYPGPRSFESNEQAIFRGRTSEIKDLLDLIRLEQVLVLFSKSGLGKSSLLNAGVGPALPAFNHQPIRVRFQIFGTQSDTAADATDTNPINSTIEYITSEYSAAYHSLQKDLDTWQQEMAQLPTGHGEQQAKQAAELERVIQQQLESLSAEHPLTDEKLAEFKQKQYEITDRTLTDTNRRVRLNNDIEAAKAALSSTTLSDIDQKYSPRTTLDPFGEQADGRLWETLKLHPFPNGATPVFFFDQFEEFFAAPRAAQRDFLTQLAELLCDQPPSRISERIAQELSSANAGQHASPSQRDDADKTRIAELTAWGRQPIVKCLFAIRDDRLAELDSLESFIPLVLKNRYKLNPLSGHNARLAIVEPAKAIGDFTTLPFSYADQNVPGDDSANTLQLIIDGLSNDKGEIDSTQLQMVCNNIEAAVERALKNTPEKVTFGSPGAGLSRRVDKRLIPNAQTIDTFINEFYTTRLNTVGSDANVDLAGHVLETYFVLDGKRIGVDEPVLKQHFLGNENLIFELVKSRLIRPEPTSRGTAYELSHDKLVEPVEKAKKNRDEKIKQKDRLKKMLTGLAIILILFFAVIIYTIWSNYKLDKNQILLNKVIDYNALIQYNAGKHYLGFRLWHGIDSVGSRIFSPYAGKDIQADTNYHHVATLYSNNELEVRKQRAQLVDTVVFRTNALGFKLTGSKLATYVSDSMSGYKVNIIDLIAKNSSLTLPQRTVNLSAVTLSPDGHYAVLIGLNGSAYLYNLSNKSVSDVNHFYNWIKSDKISLRSRKHRIVFNSSSTWLYVMDDDYHAFAYDLIHKQKFSISTEQKNNKVVAINFTPDGSKLAVIDGKYLTIYDLSKSYELPDELSRAYYILLEDPFWIVTKKDFMSNDKCILQDESRMLVINLVKGDYTQELSKAKLAGKNHVLTKENGQYVLKSTITNRMNKNKLLKPESNLRDIAFFSPDGRTDTHLIAVYLNHVSVLNLKTNKTDTLYSRGNRFGRLTLTGNLFTIQLGERSELDEQNRPMTTNADYLGFFIDMPKNRIDSMEKFVYPKLTKEQREQFGLSK